MSQRRQGIELVRPAKSIPAVTTAVSSDLVLFRIESVTPDATEHYIRQVDKASGRVVDNDNKLEWEFDDLPGAALIPGYTVSGDVCAIGQYVFGEILDATVEGQGTIQVGLLYGYPRYAMRRVLA